ncbi:MAG: hypothetical protein J6N70_16325 [Oribacterium sp.]|nr:hypothetical protein [Oribacterium sp.]MBR1856786.1 hypothetical protein [Oribacterium sp.]
MRRDNRCLINNTGSNNSVGIYIGQSRRNDPLALPFLIKVNYSS